MSKKRGAFPFFALLLSLLRLSFALVKDLELIMFRCYVQIFICFFDLRSYLTENKISYNYKAQSHKCM